MTSFEGKFTIFATSSKPFIQVSHTHINSKCYSKHSVIRWKKIHNVLGWHYISHFHITLIYYITHALSMYFAINVGAAMIFYLQLLQPHAPLPKVHIQILNSQFSIKNISKYCFVLIKFLRICWSNIQSPCQINIHS